MRTKTVKLTEKELNALREFIRTERSGCLNDVDKGKLTYKLNRATAIILKWPA